MNRALPLVIALVGASCRPAAEPAPAPATYAFAHRTEEAAKDFDEAQFRSFRKDGQLATTVTLGTRNETTESRRALVPPLPSKLTYDVRVPDGGELEFDTGVALLAGDVMPGPVSFAVSVDGEPVFEHTIRRRFGNEWTRQRVDLAAWAGQDVALTFETKFAPSPFLDEAAIAAEGLSILPAWGHPILAGKSESVSRPDLILVSVDCLRADHVGAYGHEPETTPNIDALAADGKLFENTVSVSSWTLPTHMSMLTGMMPTEHGLSRTHKRSPSTPYLPEILSREGYETLGVISGLYLSPTFGYEEGFDVYRSLVDQPAEALVDAAIELFTDEPRRPRFLFLHFFDAHWPYLAEDEYLEQAGGRPPEITDLLQNVIQRRPPANDADVAYTKRLYDAEVAYVDDHLGRFFDALETLDLYDNALIVLTADHGEGFYEHKLWQHSEIIYNEVTRVPLIVKPPRGSEPTRVEALVSQLGIFPTFLEAVGLETPFQHGGLLSEGPFPERHLSEITWEANETRGPFVKVAATEGDLKYVVTYAGDLGDEKFVSRLVKEELYDLSADPDELENLMPNGAGRLGALKGAVREYIELVQERRTMKDGEPIRVDEELAEKLKAIGYVQ